MPLHLTSVRPGCGCTVVKSDTLVLPGKSSIISAKVNVAGFHTGQQSKVVNVTSDAANTQFLQLKIILNVVKLIESSEQSIVIPIGGSHSVVITCEKNDLKVTDITFAQESASDNSEWSKQIPVTIPFTWLPLDSVCADNLKAYRLTLTSPAVSSELYGKIFLKTNHPDKPEFWINSSIVHSR